LMELPTAVAYARIIERYLRNDENSANIALGQSE
jgi:hypothetical protein